MSSFFRKSMWGLALLASLPAQALQIEGTVRQVVDGRTFVLKDKNNAVHGIILMGIDTPEQGQDRHQDSVRALTQYLGTGKVMVDWYRLESRCSKKPAKDCSKIAKVLRLSDGGDPALHLLQRGLAWHSPSTIMDQSTTDRRLYSEAEQAAQFKRLGIWVVLKPEPPWEYRKRRVSPIQPVSTKPSKSSKAKKKKKRSRGQ